MKRTRKDDGYNSRRYGDGLAAANKAEREDRRDHAPMVVADKGESGPLPKAGRRPMNGGKTSSSGGPIHKKFNFGNNSTGRGHQSHHSGERKKY